MANKFTLTITAVDKATSVVRSVNQSVAKMTSPVTNIRSSFKSLNKEIGQNPLLKGAGKLGQGIGKAFGQAAKFLPELGEMAGLAAGIEGIGGAFGGVAGPIGVAIAAIAVADMKFADFGFTLKQTALNLGATTQQVQGWHAAAGLMGVDAQAVDSSFQQLGDTIQDATMGRNQQALMFMQRLGIQLKRTKTGAVDVNDEMLQLSDVLKKYNGNPETQRLIARQFGVEAMLPALRGGRKQMEAYLKSQKKFALTDHEVEDAAKFHMKMAELSADVKGYGARIGAFTFDVSMGILRGVRDLFRDPLGTVGEMWKNLVAMIQGGIKLITGLGHNAADAVKGAAGAAGKVAGNMVGAAATGIAKFTGAGDAKSIAAFFRANGFGAAQANGIVAGMFAESHLNAGARNPTSGAFGLGQWLGPRKADFAKLFGHDLRSSTRDEQLRFMVWELKNKESRAGRAIAGASTSGEALDAYVRRYMRPAAGMETMGDLARGGSLLALLSAQGGGAANAVRPGGGTVDVNVRVQHDGRSATVKTASTGAATARPPRIERSMASVPA